MIYVDARRRLMLSAALGIGVAILVGVSLEKEKRKIRHRYAMTVVTRAKKYIPRGHKIEPKFLETVHVPVAFVEPTAVRDLGELRDAQGRYRYKAQTGILKGTQVIKANLYEDGSLLGLAWTLDPPLSALTITLPRERAGGGFVQPGDWVDVFVSFTRGRGRKSPRTILLLQKIKVAAVGQHMGDTRGAKPSTSSTDWEEESLNLTRLLTPRQSAVVIEAQHLGPVTLTLLSPFDQGHEKTIDIAEDRLLPGGF